MFKVYKKIGETPLECLQRWAKTNEANFSEEEKSKMTYAGRLDPLAEGELLILVGKECSDKERYLGLKKEYEFEILFGFGTDTYDVLGLPYLDPNLDVGCPSEYDVTKHQLKVESFLKDIRGRWMQTYPPFSSKTIGGKMLFELAKKGELGGKEIPEKEVEIYEAEFLKNYWINGRDLKADIFKRILLVRGDFRQENILEKWNELLTGQEEKNFLVSKVRVVCSGGTYMRGLANSLGKRIGLPALAFKIKRTQIFLLDKGF
jgi:tRNA pseudouridine(55) synthase